MTARALVRTRTSRCTAVGPWAGTVSSTVPTRALLAVERVDPADDGDALGAVQVVLDEHGPVGLHGVARSPPDARDPVVDTMPHHTMTATAARQPTVPTTHQRVVPGAGRGSGIRVLRRGSLTAGERMTPSILGYRPRPPHRRVPAVSDRLRLMCVHAHPDDESSKGAATMARYVDEGHEVLVVSCTGR